MRGLHGKSRAMPAKPGIKRAVSFFDGQNLYRATLYWRWRSSRSSKPRRTAPGRCGAERGEPRRGTGRRPEALNPSSR